MAKTSPLPNSEPPTSEKRPRQYAAEYVKLLTKPERRKADVPIRYVGFEIPNRFAIGYGLDHAERWRNLPYVAALSTSHDGA